MLSSTSSSEPKVKSGPRAALVGMAASFIFAFAAIVVATEWLLHAQVAPQDTQAAHLRLLSHDTRVDAAFGDSHVARGFDARDGFVNLAYPSESIDDIVAKVAYYYETRQPGRVILQADPHMFSPYRLRAAPKSYKSQPPLLITSDRHKPRLLAYWEAFIRDGGQLVSKVQITPSGALLSGGNLSEIPQRRRIFEALARRDWHRIDHPAVVQPAQERYAALLDDLTSRGADICLVSPPVSSYYSAAVANAGHDDIVHFFEDQAVRVGAKMADLRGAVSDLSLFRDVDHLNVAGARGFGDQILTACYGTESD